MKGEKSCFARNEEFDSSFRILGFELFEESLQRFGEVGHLQEVYLLGDGFG